MRLKITEIKTVETQSGTKTTVSVIAIDKTGANCATSGHFSDLHVPLAALGIDRVRVGEEFDLVPIR